MSCSLKPLRPLMSPHRSVFFVATSANYRYDSEHRKKIQSSPLPHPFLLNFQYLAHRTALSDALNMVDFIPKMHSYDLAHDFPQ